MKKPLKVATREVSTVILIAMAILSLAVLYCTNWFSRSFLEYLRTAGSVAFLNLIAFWFLVLMRRKEFKIQVDEELDALLVIFLGETLAFIVAYWDFPDLVTVMLFSAVCTLMLSWLLTLYMAETAHQVIENDESQSRAVA